VTARQIVGIAEEHGEFREALAAVAGEGGKISTGRLGKWLGKVKGRRINGMRIEDTGYRDGIALWQISGS
jgi:putative DNA primase/helicase